LGDGHTSDLKHDSFVCLAVEIDYIAIFCSAQAAFASLL
jgi:hypothetical protein